MIDRGRKNLLGVGIDAVDYDAATARILDAAHGPRPFAASALAVHGVMTGVLDRIHRRRLNLLDLVVPDGQPVRWALNLLHGTRLADRVYGPTLMLRVCAAAAVEGLPVFLFGSRIEVLAALQDNLRARFPTLRIAGSEPSRFRRLSEAEFAETASRIRTTGARIVFVGLGCPRQEVWAFEQRNSIGLPLIAVGAAFDFHAGLLSQAPAWMQRHGLEWAYRLSREPRRLWRRYIFLNPLFVLLAFLQLLKVIRLARETSPAPPVSERFG